MASGTLNMRIHLYTQLLQQAIQNEHLFPVALEQAESLTKQATEQMLWHLDSTIQGVIQKAAKKPEVLIEMLRGSRFFAEVGEFRAYPRDQRWQRSVLTTMTEQIRHQHELRDAVAEWFDQQERTTFGMDVIAALIRKEDPTGSLVETFVRHREAIEAASAETRPRCCPRTCPRIQRSPRKDSRFSP